MWEHNLGLYNILKYFSMGKLIQSSISTKQICYAPQYFYLGIHLSTFPHVYKWITLYFTPKAYWSLKTAIVIQKEKCMLFIIANRDYQRKCQRALFIKKWINKAFCNFAADISFTKAWKNAWHWTQKQKNIFWQLFKCKFGYAECSGDSLDVYIFSIIVTAKHSDNLIRLLKLSVWKTRLIWKASIIRYFWMAEKDVSW